MEYYEDNCPNWNKLRDDFYTLILEAAEGNEKRAKTLFNKFATYKIYCIADFDCSRLLNMLNISGIGKIYGQIVVNMFRIRLETIFGSADIAIPIDAVLDKEDPA